MNADPTPHSPSTTGDADNPETFHPPPRHPRQPLLAGARAALDALRAAIARQIGEPPAGGEPAGSVGAAAPVTVTVIPAAGARPSLAQQWHNWRNLLAQARRGPTQSQSQAQAQPQRQAPVPLLPAPWFRTARRWSPGIFPPGLALVLLGALALAGHLLAGHGPGILPPADILPLALIYVIGGTIYGIALYVAPTNNIWLAVLAGGAALYLFATLWVLAGPLAVAAIAVLMCIPVYFYVRHHLFTVPEEQAVATTLAGGYHRTLASGTTVLIPGERTLAAVDTTDHQFALPVQRVRVTDPDGEGFVARAAATLAYHITPSQAHLAALAADTWEHDLQQRATESLRTALGEWGHRLLDGEELPERFLARAVLDDLRPRVRPDGVTVQWVNVRDIWLTPESEVIPVAEWDDRAPADTGEEHAPRTPKRPDSPGARPPSAPGTLPSIEEAHLAPSDSEPLERETLEPDALADAYDAVRAGHIADPETIRAVARAFLVVAADAELAESFPYDAVAAAQILMERAAALEHGDQPH